MSTELKAYSCVHPRFKAMKQRTIVYLLDQCLRVLTREFGYHPGFRWREPVVCPSQIPSSGTLTMQTNLHVLKNTYILFTIINSYQKQYRSPNSTAAPSAANSHTGLWNVSDWTQKHTMIKRTHIKLSFPQPDDSIVQTDTSVRVWGGVVSLSSSVVNDIQLTGGEPWDLLFIDTCLCRITVRVGIISAQPGWGDPLRFSV